MTPRFNAFIGVLLDFETEHNPDGSVRVERDADDPGGTTKFGIDQRSHPRVDVPGLNEAQARQIYWGDWMRLPCDELPRPLGELLMDIAQNGGPGAEWIQKAVGADADGHIGPKTLAMAAEVAKSENRLGLAVDYICDRREERFRRLVENRPKARKFLRGWLNRNTAMRKWAQSHLSQA